MNLDNLKNDLLRGAVTTWYIYLVLLSIYFAVDVQNGGDLGLSNWMLAVLGLMWVYTIHVWAAGIYRLLCEEKK